MKSVEDVESYLLRMDTPHDKINPGIWLVKVDNRPLAVSIAGPVVAFRRKVMDLPKGSREDLYRTLLTLNTTEMVHGAFGLEGEAVVLVHALELENLDFNEFQAVIEDMSMAIGKHHPVLSRFLGSAAEGPAASSQQVR
jgi:hypothetical protein